MFSPEDDIIAISHMLPRLGELSDADLLRVKELLDALGRCEIRERCQNDYLAFCRQMMPKYLDGSHLKVMGKIFHRIESGDTKRMIINIAPRHSKSLNASVYFPAWFLGRNPTMKVICATHTAELAVNFGRQVRDIIDSEEYRQIFPEVSLRKDVKSAGRWNTEHGGEYWAVGVGAALAGKGADLFIIDDAHSEQEGMQIDAAAFDHVYEWFTTGPRQRLQPGGRICVVGTRWNVGDLTGRILEHAKEHSALDEWEHVTLPALLDSGKPIWPEFWSQKALEDVRRDIGDRKFEAQYQQKPTAGDKSIVPRSAWKIWKEDRPPSVDFIIVSLDTAYTAKTRNDPSAFTAWGLFQYPDERGVDRTNIICLDAQELHLEFPDLKQEAIDWHSKWKPECFLIEAKASGIPLIQELRDMGLYVQDFSPSRGAGGGDKVMRMHSVSPIFRDGLVWVPQTEYADKIMVQCEDFPYGRNDDLVDSMTQALMRFRQGGFLELRHDDRIMDEDDNSNAPIVVDWY